MGVPLTYYGVRVTYDTGKEVHSNDLPRLAVLYTQWVEIELLYIDLLLPYIEHFKKVGVTELVGKAIDRSVRLFKFAKDGLVFGLILMRNAIVMGGHIVGMLSSSYQGDADTGDGRRPDNM